MGCGEWSVRRQPPSAGRLQLQSGEQVIPAQQPVPVAVVEPPEEAELELEGRCLGKAAEDEVLFEARPARILTHRCLGRRGTAEG